jgi:hypothetical protein
MREIPDVLARLRRSPPRAAVSLRPKEVAYLRRKGRREVLGHAAAFMARRLAPAAPVNDGRQPPWHGHPVFVAQHATATCCRGCLQRWHGIPRGRGLTGEEQHYVVAVIGGWLSHYDEDSEEPPGGRGRGRA